MTPDQDLRHALALDRLKVLYRDAREVRLAQLAAGPRTLRLRFRLPLTRWTLRLSLTAS